MSAISEITELIAHPLRDVKVFTPAQIVFGSLVIFVGVPLLGPVVLWYLGKPPVPLDKLAIGGAVGGVVTGLFLWVYSIVNKKLGKS